MRSMREPSVPVDVALWTSTSEAMTYSWSDAKLMPDPDSVIRRFEPEFEKLVYLALMAGWEHDFGPEDAEALMPAADEHA